MKYAKADKSYCMGEESLEQDQQDHATREKEDLAKAKEVYDSIVRLVKVGAKECRDDQEAKLAKVAAKRKQLRDDYDEKKTRVFDTLQTLGGIEQGCTPLQKFAAATGALAKLVSVVASEQFNADDLSASMLQSSMLKGPDPEAAKAVAAFFVHYLNKPAMTLNMPFVAPQLSTSVEATRIWQMDRHQQGRKEEESKTTKTARRMSR